MLKVKENYEMNRLTKPELVELVTEIDNKLNMQENFLLNISHDLRNPINVILSIIQFMEYRYDNNNEDYDEKNREYLQLIKRNSFKMIKLIDNLIDTTKLEGNYYKLNKKNVDIVAMVEGTVSSIDEYAQQKDIQLVFDTNVEECIAAVDPQALDRIVMNLLSNAIKFSSKNSNIYITTMVNDNDIKISVKDEGPGIPKEEQQSIFSRFVQSSNNKKGEYAGSGIGLDLVNYLTKAHDGEIELNSEEGKGSEFIVKIPRVSVKNDTKSFELIEKNKVQQLQIEFSDIYL